MLFSATSAYVTTSNSAPLTSHIPNPAMLMTSSPPAAAQATGLDFPPVRIKQEPLDVGYGMTSMTSPPPAASVLDFKPFNFDGHMTHASAFIPTPTPPLPTLNPLPYLPQPSVAPPVTSAPAVQTPKPPVKGRRGRKPQVTAYVSARFILSIFLVQLVVKLTNQRMEKN